MPNYLLQATSKNIQVKSILKSNLPVTSIGGMVVLYLFYALCANVNANDFTNIGSGSPGLRVIVRHLDPDSIVIYHESPESPFGGYANVSMTNENIHVVFDHGFHFDKTKIFPGLTGDGPVELYSFGTNSAFTDEAGVEWGLNSDYWPIECSQETGYTFENGSLTIFTNVQQVARAKYRLNSDEIFLGFLDNRVFFCKNSRKPDKVYWRQRGSQNEYYYRMPKAVINVYGVMKALNPDKDVGFVALRRKPLFSNIWIPPGVDAFIEISFSSGKLVRNMTE